MTPSLDFLQSLRQLELMAKYAVDGILPGVHPGKRNGGGVEFQQYRGYVPGDDPKFIDWKLLAREDKLYSRCSRLQTSMDCMIVIDTSASMAYQGDNAPFSKFEYARLLAACFGILATRQNDSVSILALSDTLPGGFSFWRRLSQTKASLPWPFLDSLSPAGSAPLADLLPLMRHFLKRQGLAVILSDFHDAEATLPQILRNARALKMSCIICQILDEDELTLPFEEPLEFKDCESPLTIPANPIDVREDYHRKLADFTEAIRTSCLDNDAAYLRATASSDIRQTLLGFFGTLSRKHGN